MMANAFAERFGSVARALREIAQIEAKILAGNPELHGLTKPHPRFDDTSKRIPSLSVPASGGTFSSLPTFRPEERWRLMPVEMTDGESKNQASRCEC